MSKLTIERAMIAFALFVIVALAGVLLAQGRAPSVAVSQSAQGRIVVDHTSVALFEQIPPQYIEAARAMTMLFMDKSVGENISGGLDCLAGTGPASCGITPPQPYSRAAWAYQWFAEAGCGAWSDLQNCFVAQTGPALANYDAAMYGMSYMEVDQAGALNYFNQTPALNEVGDYIAFLTAADKPVVLWTSSLNRGADVDAESWNEMMRGYAASNGHHLFDLADILSHRPDGEPCLSLAGPYPAICYPDYTAQIVPGGGHLNKPGQIRAAKALWVLMAQLAGWRPGAVEPTPTLPIILPTDSPLPTPTSAPTFTPSPTPCDCPPCCVAATDTPMPPATEMPPAPTPNPPTQTPLPTDTPVPPTLPPTRTPSPTPVPLCPMPPAMAEYTADLYDAALLFRNHIWPAFNDYGMISRDQVIATRNACRDRARGYE